MTTPADKGKTTAKGLAVGVLAAFLVCLAIYIGSGGLEHFDHALYYYAVGSVLGAFAVGYRFTIWASRPPSRMYFRRGFQLLLKSGPKYAKRSPESKNASAPAELAKAAATNFAAQNFIRKRSYYRWIMHICLSGGCTIAFAVTFPLVFGWVHFATPIDNAEIYHVMLFGIHVDTVNVHSIKAGLLFNALNIAAILALVGLVMAFIRRLTDEGEKATQTFYEDFLPLIIIALVTVTGLALTVSYKFMDGNGHGTLAWIHMLCVIALIFYIPFGKLFHMFQRSCSLCVSMYKKSGENEEQAVCIVTGQEYAPKRHVDDMKEVLDELGFNYRYQDENGNEIHYADVSPAGRRRLLALNQGRSLGR